jgi:hypothetical protein
MPQCRGDCGKITKRIVIIGLIAISFIVFFTVIQFVLHVFYVQNKNRVTKLQLIFEEILVFFQNLIVIMYGADDVLHDVNRILSDIANVEGHVNDILQNVLTAVQ